MARRIALERPSTARCYKSTAHREPAVVSNKSPESLKFTQGFSVYSPTRSHCVSVPLLLLVDQLRPMAGSDFYVADRRQSAQAT